MEAKVRLMKLKMEAEGSAAIPQVRYTMGEYSQCCTFSPEVVLFSFEGWTFQLPLPLPPKYRARARLNLGQGQRWVGWEHEKRGYYPWLYWHCAKIP